MAAEIPDGAFLVARAIFNSSLWTMRAEDRILAITCIGIANWKPRKIWFDGKEKEVGRGQFIRSLKQLTEASRLSTKNVRTSLNNLISAEFMAREPAGVSYVYTIRKYDKYQDLTKYADSEWPDAAQEVAQKAAQDRQDPGKRPARDRQETGNKQESYKGDERKEGEEAGASAPSSPLGLLLQKAEAASVPGKPETIRGYLKAWVARSDYTRVEQILMDSWTKGKTVIEIQDHFWPKQNGRPKERGISDENGKTKCLNCGGTKTVAGDVVGGVIKKIPCPRC